MVRRRRQAGYSLMEVLVALSIFSAFLAVLFILTAEMRGWDKRLPMNYVRHPQVGSVIARMRKDVLDMHLPPGANPYDTTKDDYQNGPKTLVFDTLRGGALSTVVWDFSRAGIVQRIEYTGKMKTSTWTARGVPPAFVAGVGLDAVEMEGRPFGVRLRAKDEKGQLAVDQIFQPRAHQ